MVILADYKIIVNTAFDVVQISHFIYINSGRGIYIYIYIYIYFTLQVHLLYFDLRHNL